MIVPEAVRELLARHEALFLTGTIVELASDYRNPVAVFLPDGLRVEQTAADTLAALCRLQALAVTAGAVSAQHSILSVSPVRAGRVSVLVGWDFRDARLALIAQSRVRYFLAVQPDGTYLIEMLEYEQHAFPDKDPFVLRRTEG